VQAPRYWTITTENIKVNRVNAPSAQTLLVWQRQAAWRIFQGPLGQVMEKAQALWYRQFTRRMAAREKRRAKRTGN
ncbi:MAG: hypothetical protein ABIJ95_11875, partial [Pseudomonadota bacterium]